MHPNDNDAKIVELKSGRLPFPSYDSGKIALNHEVQTAVYRMMVESVFGKDARHVDAAILYSAGNEPGENLRFAAVYRELEKRSSMSGTRSWPLNTLSSMAITTRWTDYSMRCSSPLTHHKDFRIFTCRKLNEYARCFYNAAIWRRHGSTAIFVLYRESCICKRSAMWNMKRPPDKLHSGTAISKNEPHRWMCSSISPSWISMIREMSGPLFFPEAKPIMIL